MGQALQHQAAEIDLGLGAVEEGDLDDAAALGGSVVIAVDIVTADHVEDQVDAAPAGRSLRRRDEIFRAVVDGVIGAEFAAGGALVVGSRRCQDRRAEGLGELDRRGADARGAAVHHEALALLQSAALEDIGPDGEIGLGDGAGFLQRQPGGNRQGIVLMDHGVLGVAAAGDERADLVADLVARDAFAEGDDPAGDLQSGNVGGAGRRGIATHALQYVGSVDAGDRDMDQDLAGTGLRHRALLWFQDFRAAGGIETDGGHGLGQGGHAVSPRLWSRRSRPIKLPRSEDARRGYDGWISRRRPSGAEAGP